MLVVLDKAFYRDKLVLKDHLNTETYSSVPNNTDKKVMLALKSLLKKHEKCLYKQEISYINNKKWKSSNIYVTPKIHKNETIIEACAASNST